MSSANANADAIAIANANANANANSANMTLTSNKKTGIELECAICYKSVNSGFFQCSKPCGKVFHQSCMLKCMDETIESAYQNDIDVKHRCCYCRRDLNPNVITLQLFARELHVLNSGGGYDVSDALKQVYARLRSGDVDSAFDETGEYIDRTYDIYSIIYIEYIKRPKQAKNAEFKKNAQRKQQSKRIVIKQNIGGRRR